MSFIDLRCPACSAPLTAASGIRVYVCSGCAGTSTPPPPDSGGRAAQRLWTPPRYLAKPRRPLPAEGRIVLFPLWVFPLEDEAVGSGLPQEIRVPALGRRAYGRLVATAQRMSRDPVPLELQLRPSEGMYPPPPEAELSIEEAYAVAEEVALAHRQGWPPEPELETWEPPLGSICLVDLPCHETPSGLVELAQGLALDGAAHQALETVDARSILWDSVPVPSV